MSTLYVALQAQFYASKVTVSVLGTVTPLSSNPRLDVNLRHLGTPAVISTRCEKYTFTHNFRDSTYSYNVGDPSIVYSDGYLGGCGSGMMLMTLSCNSQMPISRTLIPSTCMCLRHETFIRAHQ